MNENTKEEYRRLAKHFYAKNEIHKPTAKSVSDALKQCAADYRPDYWRRLRSALTLSAFEQGFYKAADKIAATKNPITSNPKRRGEIKAKQRRQKSVSAADEKQLMDYLFEKKEKVVFAAITLVSYLGCRPAELANLTFIEGQSILIPSAKKTADGKRGLDRIIQIEDDSLFNSLQTSHEILMNAPYTNPVRYIQRRLDTLTHRLWPKRNVLPSLYSWRHQMGSDLKASNVDPCEIAVIMGHQSTESVQVYGDSRTSRSSRDYLKPSRDFVKDVQRKNSHRLLKNINNKITLANLGRLVTHHYPKQSKPG